jgi:lysophospholipase L1-like esterase
VLRERGVRRVALLALALAACPGGDPGDDTGSSGADVGGTTAGPTGGPTAAPTSEPPGPTTGDPPPTSGTDDTGTGDTSTGDPGVPEVHWVGRHDASDPNAVRMGWSGVGAVVRFAGTGASVTLDDAARWFTVVVDGAVQPPLATSGGVQTYPLATGLPAGEHTVELYRRTEGSFGPTVVLGFELEGELLPPPAVTRRIEVIGDSISCGYGNEGEAPCSFSAETENHYLTYGAFAARALGAELSTVAWSGKGMVYNYGDDKNEPMPTLYDRTVATEGAAWGFAWQPDVVVINLGTNDFSTDDDPPEDVFVPAYVAFLEHLRAVYPDAFLLPVAPSLFGDEVALVAGYLQAAVDQRHAAGDMDVAFEDVNVPWIGSGCDGHPSVATHEQMGMKLAQALQAHLGW